MKPVYSARDIEEMARNGGLKSLPADAILTPSARDVLREFEENGAPKKSTPEKQNSSAAATSVAPPTPSSSPRDLEAFFNSPKLHELKLQICDVGRRLWQRAYVDGNGGNIAVRVADGLALCTPTLVSKGFMKPEDMCLVDLEGNQLAGAKKRTSEILMHLQIMKRQPRAVATVHCHPPHATAFAVAREPIPQCVLPEVEVFLGDVPITKYETPGGQVFADTIIPFVKKANVIILANHGTVSYGETVEKAFWWTEILDAYCRILMLAKSLGRIEFLGEQKSNELLDLKTKWGFTDARLHPGMENCDICANDVFRDSWQATGVERKAFDAPPPASRITAGGSSSSNGSTATAPAGQEALVKMITEQVMAALAAQGK
jgi:L-fuculose-phosphate aldolase